MRRRKLPIEQLQAWAILNGVRFNGTTIKVDVGSGNDSKGAGVFTITDINNYHDHEGIVLHVPHDLVLSKELVDDYARSDVHLRELLEATGDFGRSTRGSILIFLLMQIAISSPDFQDARIGVSNPLTDYVSFLPAEFALPTFWSQEELELLQGTSLADAVDQKNRSLENEFELLRTSTQNISWCARHWWDDKTGRVTMDDWRLVDAMFRSRALELPDLGHAMVPLLDTANHSSGELTVAVYETDELGNAELQLRHGKSLKSGDEVTITYGDGKGASEMIFSYGFLETGMSNARQLFLSLDIPYDDPLRTAKRAVCDEAPGVRLSFRPGGKVEWESRFVWWACVNEEDGLAFRLIQGNDGEKELKLVWKDEEIGAPDLPDKLLMDPLRKVFELRATVMLQEKIEEQATELEDTEESFVECFHRSEVRNNCWQIVRRLRTLELDLLAEAYQTLEGEKLSLCSLRVVQQYLEQAAASASDTRMNGSSDDFS